MMRRVLAAVLAALLLTGCWSRVEVNDLAIVTMMGIDKTEDGQIAITINVVIPPAAGGGRGESGAVQGQGGRSYIMLRGVGRTILEAAKFVQMELPRRIFWAHTRVILLGERLAKEGVRDALDFLTRYRELRLTNYLVVVRGSLEEVMATRPDLETLPVEYIREISRSRIGTVITVGDFARDLAAKGAAPNTGVVEPSPPPPGAPTGQQPALKLTGTALFREDKLVGYVDEHITRGLLWLRGEMHLGVVTVEVPQAPGRISLEWVRTNVSRTARMEGGRPVVRVEAKVEADVGEEQAKLDLSDPKVMGLIEKEMNKAVKERMEAALEELRTLNTDAAGFGEVIHRQLPAVWKGLEKGWHKDGLQKTKVVISVDARVRRTGLSSKPKGVGDEELIKGGE